MPRTKVCIIIPSHNRRDFLKSLLTQLRLEVEGNGEPGIRIIVVNDGSEDGTDKMLSADFPEIIEVKGNGNWWYTMSMNEGFKHAEIFDPEYVLTLNDDLVLEKGYLNKLLKDMESVQARSILGSLSLSLSKPHKVIFPGNLYRNKIFDFMSHHLDQFSEVDPASLFGIHETITLPGRGMLIPFQILKELDYFDERFVQYRSDTDFCLRAGKKGIKCYISWNARIFSHIGKTGKGTSYIKSSFKNFIRSFFNKYSRLYLPSAGLFYYRHKPLLLWPVFMAIMIITAFKNYFFRKKIAES